jgi:hypothetical protein
MPVANRRTIKSLPTKATATAAARELRVENANSSAGQIVTVSLPVDAFGDESGYGFTLTYINAILQNPSVVIGTAGGNRFCNTTVAGTIQCSVRNFSGENPNSTTDQIGEIGAGNNQQLVKITFTVASNAPSGTTPLTLSNVNASNDAAQSLAITSQNGTVAISGPTAAEVSVSGNVVNTNGAGVRNVRLTLTSSSGESRTVLSGESGYYEFTEVVVGETYILTVSAKKYTVPESPRILNINDELNEINFLAVAKRWLR